MTYFKSPDGKALIEDKETVPVSLFDPKYFFNGEEISFEENASREAYAIDNDMPELMPETKFSEKEWETVTSGQYKKFHKDALEKLMK